MTLSSFKKNSKKSFLLGFLLIYGATFYLLGTFHTLEFVANLKGSQSVKGTNTKNEIVGPIDSPVPFADTQGSAITASYIKRCSNTHFGFEVAYPKDWFTTYNTDEQKCTFFAPYSFTVPTTTADFTAPIKIEVVKPDDWDGAVKFYENPNDFQDVISTQHIQVSGHAVEKIRARSTGGGLIAKGLVKLTYLYQDSKTLLVFTYQQTESKENPDANSKILEDMVSSVSFF